MLAETYQILSNNISEVFCIRDKINNGIQFISAVVGIISFVISLSEINNSILAFSGGALVAVFCMLIFIYVKSVPKYTVIDGLRIEAADEIPLFISRKNQLNPIDIIHTCIIKGNDAEVEYDYYGLCCRKQGCEKFAIYSFSCDVNEFLENQGAVFDLKNDPLRRRKLPPENKPPGGTTKKLVFKFLSRVNYNTTFHYLSHEEVKNTIKSYGKDYYLSSVFYKNRPLNSYKVILKFYGVNPKTVDVYDVHNRKGKFNRRICEYQKEGDAYIYIDEVPNPNAWSMRCYIFDRG